MNSFHDATRGRRRDDENVLFELSDERTRNAAGSSIDDADVDVEVVAHGGDGAAKDGVGGNEMAGLNGGFEINESGPAQLQLAQDVVEKAALDHREFPVLQ